MSPTGIIHLQTHHHLPPPPTTPPDPTTFPLPALVTFGSWRLGTGWDRLIACITTCMLGCYTPALPFPIHSLGLSTFHPPFVHCLVPNCLPSLCHPPRTCAPNFTIAFLLCPVTTCALPACPIYLPPVTSHLPYTPCGTRTGHVWHA